MVKDFDFQKLPGTDEVTRHLDVRIAWRGVPRWMIMLCEAPVNVQEAGASRAPVAVLP